MDNKKIDELVHKLTKEAACHMQEDDYDYKGFCESATSLITAALYGQWVIPHHVLPKEGQHIWFVSNGMLNRGRFYPLDQWYRPNMFIADSGGYFTSSPQGNETYTHPVTHWMPLNFPPPPKQ